jgi:hypothetical protein
MSSAISAAEKPSTSNSSRAARWLAGRCCSACHEGQLDVLAALGPAGRVGVGAEPGDLGDRGVVVHHVVAGRAEVHRQRSPPRRATASRQEFVATV